MDLLAEGVESLKLACSLVLLVPALGVMLLGRRRLWLVPTWIITVSLIAWLRFTGWWTPLPSGIAHIAAGFGLAGLAVLAWKRNDLVSDIAATAGVAFIAGWTWIPCVGRELADILNNARAEPWAELAPTFIYLLGLFLPVVLFAALQVAWPKFGEVIELEWLRTAGLTIIFAVGALVAVTLFDDLASELAERSSF
jgi:cytochrome c biogenesis protein CcdA